MPSQSGYVCSEKLPKWKRLDQLQGQCIPIAHWINQHQKLLVEAFTVTTSQSKRDQNTLKSIGALHAWSGQTCACIPDLRQPPTFFLSGIKTTG
jgi:hypothetical protein